MLKMILEQKNYYQKSQTRLMLQKVIKSISNTHLKIKWKVLIKMLMVLYYVFAVIATNLFAEAFPEWFGGLGRSAYSLFQIMTLESWSMGIVRPVMEVFPYAWLFFVPFILVTTFAVVNLVVGLMVNSMQDAHQAEARQQTDSYRDDVLSRLTEIEAAMKRLAPPPPR